MNKIKILLTLIISCISGLLHAKDPIILVSLNEPAYGVKIKNNFVVYNGTYERAFMLSNQDASVNLIGLGAYGNVVNGVSTLAYGYIGARHDYSMMSFLPNGNVGIGTITPITTLHIQNSSEEMTLQMIDLSNTVKNLQTEVNHLKNK